MNTALYDRFCSRNQTDLSQLFCNDLKTSFFNILRQYTFPTLSSSFCSPSHLILVPIPHCTRSTDLHRLQDLYRFSHSFSVLSFKRIHRNQSVSDFRSHYDQLREFSCKICSARSVACSALLFPDPAPYKFFKMNNSRTGKKCLSGRRMPRHSTQGLDIPVLHSLLFP